MKLAAFLITLVLAAGGALLAGRVSDTFAVAMVVTGIWFAVLTAVAAFVVWRRRPLAVPVGAALAAVVIAMTVLVGLPTLFGTSVDEDVVVGAAPAAVSDGTQNANIERLSGRFEPVAHEGRGRAAVVELAEGGRKLTLTSFETSSGPDLRVYLTTGDPATGDRGRHVDLGALKGNRGDQQYDVPAGVDLARYRVVVVWCRAFSVPFTSAALHAAA